MRLHRLGWPAGVSLAACVFTLGCNDNVANLPDLAMGTDVQMVAPPTVGAVTCNVPAIPCNDAKQTPVTCSGSGMGFTGKATYVWKCIPEIGCSYSSPPGAAQTCVGGDGNDTLRCDSETGSSQVVINCNGKKPESCSLIVVKDNVASLTTTMPPQGRFAIGLSPACPMPGDMMIHDGGPADMTHDVAHPADAAPASDAGLDATPADVSQDLIGVDTRG